MTTTHAHSGLEVSEQILEEVLDVHIAADIDLSGAPTETLAPLLPRVHILRNALTAGECEQLISAGFNIRECTHPVVWRKWDTDPHAQDKVGKRTIYKADDVAGMFWKRIGSHVPARVTTISHGVLSTWEAIGVSDRLKFVQYTAGQDFPMHVDGPKVISDDERSQVSVLFYLDSTDGGQLQFFDPPGGDIGMGAATKQEPTYITQIAPEAGMCVWFSHKPYLHQSARLVSGRKYCIRTDIMYRRISTEPTSEADRLEALPA
eukprot:c8528_g1_i2.p1 GENE.c8528_g1_i2~~c8528_g1_i2.p1  ORF type:complete len:262 (+),score=43.17 c8528_g1_i2:100-885(+)